VALDIWGRDLGAAVVWDPEPEWAGSVVPMGGEPARFDLTLSAADHDDAVFQVRYGGGGPEDFAVEGSGEWRTATSFADGDCPVETLYVGLDHLWFAPSGAAPTDSKVTLLMDGEEAWASVHEALEGARERVVWATWFWESDFELIRSPWEDASSREESTSMGMLESLGGVDRKVLINRFWGENSDYSQYLNTDSALRDKASGAGDGFDVVLQGNATEVPVSGEYGGVPPEWSFTARVQANPAYADRAFTSIDRVARGLAIDAASWHQKAVVVDGEVAFVGGMNTKAADWDSNDHLVFDARRMTFDSDYDDRIEVEYREELPDVGPRKDYAVRLEGPAARDVEEVLWRRWEEALDEGLLYADKATTFELDEAGSVAGGVEVQVVATMPGEEMAILETHRKAIEQATDYILIEDQYFRAPLLDEVIVDRMDAEPELYLLVVTMPMSEWDPGLKYTYLAWEKLTRLFPERVLFLQLRTWDMVAIEDWIYDDIYFYDQQVNTHSKLRLVDDRYLSVGSCNWNNRGYLYEGELDVAILDEGVASSARARILDNYVGAEYAGYLTGEMANDIEVLALVAEDNQLVAEYWDEWAYWYDDREEAEADWDDFHPSGFVYPVSFSDDYFDVGPDLF
jgi:phosphatidylserine/phosphatidylglycerophosphate/cardiolipin synthase-like enzyme